MSMKILARTAAVTFMAAGLLSSADAQKLRIESPQNGATVAPVAGMPNAIVIRFKADDFKIVRLNESSSGNQAATTTTTTSTAGSNPMDASASRPDVGATPAPTGSAKQEDMSTQATSNMPQSDQSATTTSTTTTTTGNAKADRGQIRVTVDDSKWQFLHSSKDPITIVGLSPGQHNVKLELVGPNGMAVGSAETVNFNVGGSR